MTSYDLKRNEKLTPLELSQAINMAHVLKRTYAATAAGGTSRVTDNLLY